MSKAIVMGYLAKVSAANVNASHTEGNVVVAKKVTLPDGSTIPYISGQAVQPLNEDASGAVILGADFEPSARVSLKDLIPGARKKEHYCDPPPVFVLPGTIAVKGRTRIFKRDDRPESSPGSASARVSSGPIRP